MAVIFIRLHDDMKADIEALRERKRFSTTSEMVRALLRRELEKGEPLD